MSLFGKLEVEVEIKASASKFHEMFHKRPHHISNAGDKVEGCELHEGDWGEVGSIICWNYFLDDGKARAAKHVIEAVDEEKNLITFKVIEADFLEFYKTFTFTLQVIPKGEGSVVHWTLEYEKLNETIPDSHVLLQLCVDVTKDIDAHLVEGN